MDPVSAALALLGQVLADLPAPPHPDDGYGALFAWLRSVNASLTIPDADLRWKIGVLSIPALLLVERAGIRKTWTLYPLLVPLWAVCVGLALGAVAGLAAAAAHVVLFPVGRVWFTVLELRRARDARAAAPVPAPVPVPVPAPAPTPASPRAMPAPPLRQLFGAVLEALRAAAEEGRRAPPQAANRKDRQQARAAILRAVAASLSAAAAGQPGEGPRRRPSPARGDSSSQATGEAPGRTDFARFRPDLSRFQRRPPGG